MDTEAERLLKERALESTAEGVVISECRDGKMPIIYVNRAFTAMTGYSPDEVLGRNCRFLQGPETDGATTQAIRDAISADLGCTVEILNYRKDGTVFWNRLSIMPVRDDEGQVTHFIGIQNDITRVARQRIRCGRSMHSLNVTCRQRHPCSRYNCRSGCRRWRTLNLPGGIGRARSWRVIR